MSLSNSSVHETWLLMIQGCRRFKDDKDPAPAYNSVKCIRRMWPGPRLQRREVTLKKKVGPMEVVAVLLP